MVTFPQIVIDGESIGGFDQLLAADRAGTLKEPRRRLSDAPRPSWRGSQSPPCRSDVR